MPVLVLTASAESSLEDITDYYLTIHSPQRAIKVIESIEDAFDKIIKSPNFYPVCFDIAKPVSDIRQIIVHNTFKIIYRISPNKIEIIEIFHGSRDPGLLKDV